MGKGLFKKGPKNHETPDYNENDAEENNKVKNFVSGKKVAYWYRGLAMDYKYYPKTTEKELNQVLTFDDADKIVFGHTVKEDIIKEFNGKTIITDVKHGQEKNTGKTKGILIENRTEYKIDDKGTKTNFNDRNKKISGYSEI